MSDTSCPICRCYLQWTGTETYCPFCEPKEKS